MRSLALTLMLILGMATPAVATDNAAEPSSRKAHAVAQCRILITPPGPLQKVASGDLFSSVEGYQGRKKKPSIAGRLGIRTQARVARARRFMLARRACSIPSTQRRRAALVRS